MMQSEEVEMRWEDTAGLIGGVADVLLPPPGAQCQTLGAGHEGMDRDMAGEDIQHRCLPLETAEVVQG